MRSAEPRGGRRGETRPGGGQGQTRLGASRFDVVASIVLYRTPAQMVRAAVGSLRSTRLRVHVVLVDNDGTGCGGYGESNGSVSYIRTTKNLGYGGGHNVAIRAFAGRARYHLVLNPDVWLMRGAMDGLYGFMESNPDVGMCAPRVLSPDGSPQYLCKLLPTPADLFVRRFVPIARVQELHAKRYELRQFGYDRVLDVPYLSGCCMFVRAEALRQAGLFDERFFMYPEDIDLTRRVGSNARTVFFPGACVVHAHAKASYRSMKMLWVHLTNMVRYFNKWGWIVDRQRTRRNRATLQQAAHLSLARRSGHRLVRAGADQRVVQQ